MRDIGALGVEHWRLMFSTPENPFFKCQTKREMGRNFNEIQMKKKYRTHNVYVQEKGHKWPTSPRSVPKWETKKPLENLRFIALPKVPSTVKPAACVQRQRGLGSVMQVFSFEFKSISSETFILVLTILISPIGLPTPDIPFPKVNINSGRDGYMDNFWNSSIFMAKCKTEAIQSAILYICLLLALAYVLLQRFFL